MENEEDKQLVPLNTLCKIQKQDALRSICINIFQKCSQNNNCGIQQTSQLVQFSSECKRDSKSEHSEIKNQNLIIDTQAYRNLSESKMQDTQQRSSTLTQKTRDDQTSILTSKKKEEIRSNRDNKTSMYTIKEIINSQTGRRNKIFLCTFPGCTKEFYKKWNCTEHYKIHSKEKPFACYTCEMYFAQKGSLLKHIKAKVRRGDDHGYKKFMEKYHGKKIEEIVRDKS